LDQKIIKLLSAMASKTGKTRSELIRDAINEVYSTTDVKAAIGKLSGLQSFTSGVTDKQAYRQERQW
jgi:metal-responsive CopG/Arc/MetJ family transcriptional regulator